MNVGLVDILPLQPPPESPPLGVVIALFLLLSVAIVFLWRWYRAPHRRARRRLRRLYVHVRRGQLDARRAANELAALLRMSGDERLAPFADRLETARFAAEPCDGVELAALLDAADLWLSSLS